MYTSFFVLIRPDTLFTDRSETENNLSPHKLVKTQLKSGSTINVRSSQGVSLIFKKDGRMWLHKTSTVTKYGKENLIAGRYKKDSRIWLHKRTRKRKLFISTPDNSLMEIDNFSTLPHQLKETEKCLCGKKKSLKLQSPCKVSFFSLPDMSAELRQLGEPRSKMRTKSPEISPILADDLPSPRTRWKNILSNQLKKTTSLM